MNLERVHTFLITAIAFCIPIYSNLVPPLIVLAALCWLAEPSKLAIGFREIAKNKSVLMSILLFILYGAGVLYSLNKIEGGQILETKLSLIIFPLILSTRVQNTNANIHKYLRFFIYGCITSAVICFGWALYCYLKPVYVLIDGQYYDLGASYFYYGRLSPLIHPSYISMYVNFGLLSIYYLNSKKLIKLDWKWSIAVLFLSAFVLLLSSKAGWVGLFLLILFVSVKLFLKRKPIEGIVILILLGAMFYIFNISAPEYSQRISAATTAVINSGSDEKLQKSAEGTASRILVWQAAGELIVENLFFGAGTGDAKAAMLVKYKEKNMMHEYEHKLNSHNQYLNTGIALGITGLSCLLACIIIPFFRSLRNGNILFNGFVCIAGINFLFESMLETQSGVMFYAFFHVLLSYCYLSYKTDEPINTI